MTVTFEVIQAFSSARQRFGVGDKIEAGADLSPHTADSLISAGYLAAIDLQPVKTKRRSR
ncbi:hypothetical protein IB024_00275 [Brucella sp. 6810]|uniref:hypothetical protein n=1 Tax=Brucella sp. 6810 TaxID=2769351 RepID=UPI00165CA1E1|nr:hypothetical protein [Brucella sp. 6810]QNQ62236.1 hypothetical protein IB024_00275 [Brucella sp. 6810]